MRALAWTLAALLGASNPQASIQTPVSYPLVHRVTCEGGRLIGSAFRIGPREFATAAHVAANIGCMIDGSPVEIDAIQGRLDFAVIRSGKPKFGRFEIDCGGFIPGHWYYAVGYAAGLTVQTLVPVYATSQKYTGERLLVGPQFIPGMSGGSVFGADGRAVGTVNALIVGTDYSVSRELKDTILCRS